MATIQELEFQIEKLKLKINKNDHLLKETYNKYVKAEAWGKTVEKAAIKNLEVAQSSLDYVDRKLAVYQAAVGEILAFDETAEKMSYEKVISILKKLPGSFRIQNADKGVEYEYAP